MESSRNAILAAIKQNQPAWTDLPYVTITEETGTAQQFTEVLSGIGGSVSFVSNYEEIISILQLQFNPTQRIVTTVPELSVFEATTLYDDGHELEDVELAIVSSRLAIAENAAVWITAGELPHRVLPFIAQHLAVIVSPEAIVADMHQAYAQLEQQDYSYGVFIAGPSRTADIEQALVLGAHGPKSLHVFILSHNSA